MEIQCEWCGDLFFRTKRPLTRAKYGQNEHNQWRKVASAGDLVPVGRTSRYCGGSCRKAACVFRASVADLDPAKQQALRAQHVRWFVELRTQRRKAKAKRTRSDVSLP
jgi:hypothetical protein